MNLLIPTKEVGECVIPKAKEEFKIVEWRKVLLDNKVKYELYCSLTANNLNHVSMCTTTKVIWDTLVVTFEGNVKSKIVESTNCFKNMRCSKW